MIDSFQVRTLLTFSQLGYTFPKNLTINFVSFQFSAILITNSNDDCCGSQLSFEVYYIFVVRKLTILESGSKKINLSYFDQSYVFGNTKIA